jgi:hypothetical protein
MLQKDLLFGGKLGPIQPRLVKRARSIAKIKELCQDICANVVNYTPQNPPILLHWW